MQEERRIEEMHMQLKMKELELEQFMLSKKKGRECLWYYLQIQNKFDIVKYIRFLPPILEKDMDK
jgi:hypothetical protein